jgi:hypothetical protein
MRRLLTEEAGIRSLNSPCEICWGKEALRQDFLQLLRYCQFLLHKCSILTNRLMSCVEWTMGQLDSAVMQTQTPSVHENKVP